jgi:hypothetical protein
MAIFERKPLFTVPTPWDRVPKVTLFEDTWRDHIEKRHVFLAGKETVIQSIVSMPTHILPGTTNPDYVIYVNDTITTPGGTPLAVIVNPEEQIICTAYPSRSLKVIPMEQAIWLPSGIK